MPMQISLSATRLLWHDTHVISILVLNMSWVLKKEISGVYHKPEEGQVFIQNVDLRCF